jgi:hypothetical protein
MKKQAKPGYLGTAFHTWLEWLEYVECVTQTTKRPGKPKYMAMNDKLFKVDSDDDFQKMMRDAMPVDAWLARCVRSSVKYAVASKTLALMTHQYEKELDYIYRTRPMHLPHEWNTIVVDGWDNNTTFMMCAQETVTKTGKDYPELDVAAHEKWICVNFVIHSKNGVDLMGGKHSDNQKLSYVPVELHMTKGETVENTRSVWAMTAGMEVTEEGEKMLNLMRGMFFSWLKSFHLNAILRRKSLGTPPMSADYIPHKRRKKNEFPRFEHVVMELEIDEPEPAQTGRHVFQPKKRMHQVRGFWRQTKSGKDVWVKPHWRGDEKLGVVKRVLDRLRSLDDQVTGAFFEMGQILSGIEHGKLWELLGYQSFGHLVEEEMSFTAGTAGKYYHTYRHMKRLGYTKSESLDLIRSFSFTRIAEWSAKAKIKVGKRAVGNAIQKILENKHQINFTVNKEEYELINRVLKAYGAEQSESGRWLNSTPAFVDAMALAEKPRLRAVS